MHIYFAVTLFFADFYGKLFTILYYFKFNFTGSDNLKFSRAILLVFVAVAVFVLVLVVVSAVTVLIIASVVIILIVVLVFVFVSFHFKNFLSLP